MTAERRSDRRQEPPPRVDDVPLDRFERAILRLITAAAEAQPEGPARRRLALVDDPTE